MPGSQCTPERIGNHEALLRRTAARPKAFGTSAPSQALAAGQPDDPVAPIALYADPLVGRILVASTYRLGRNPRLTGAAPAHTAQQQSGDPGNQAVVAIAERPRRRRFRRVLPWQPAVARPRRLVHDPCSAAKMSAR